MVEVEAAKHRQGRSQLPSWGQIKKKSFRRAKIKKNNKI
jgi:hypothetical protein